jgi:hypothetical protein
VACIRNSGNEEEAERDNKTLADEQQVVDCYVYIYVYMFMYVYIYVYIYVCVYILKYMYIYICIYGEEVEGDN